MPTIATDIQLCAQLAFGPGHWAASAADRTSADPGRPTVLVVDDDTRVRRLTARMLEEEGYQVVEAESGQEALRRLKGDAAIRVVVTDVVMPEMDGLALADRVLGLSPERRVVLMTGHAPELLGRMGLRTSRLPLLMKPFTVDQLVRQVEKALGQLFN